MSALVYICGPYTAPTKDEIDVNVRRAEEFGQHVLSMGLIPIIPHKITSHWDSWGILTEKPHSWWLEQYCLPLLSRCDAAFFIPGWEVSRGAKQEHNFCLQRRISRYYTIRELENLVF